MVVKIDLRIPGRVTSVDKDKDYKHIVLFTSIAFFFLTSFAVLAFGAWKLHTITAERNDLSFAVDSAMDKISVMDVEFEVLTSKNDSFVSKLDYVLSDTPSIEFLTALTGLLPEGVTLDSIKMTPESVSLTGTGMTEELILLFVDRLNNSPFVLTSELPSIKPLDEKGIGVRSFSFNFMLRSLSDIIKDRYSDVGSADTVPQNGIKSGDTE